MLRSALARPLFKPDAKTAAARFQCGFRCNAIALAVATCFRRPPDSMRSRSPWNGYANSLPKAAPTTTPNPAPAPLARFILTPLELLDRLAALVPPPRSHRHRCFGALAARMAAHRKFPRRARTAGAGRVRPISLPPHSAVIDPLLSVALWKTDVHGLCRTASCRQSSSKSPGSNQKSVTQDYNYATTATP